MSIKGVTELITNKLSDEEQSKCDSIVKEYTDSIDENMILEYMEKHVPYIKQINQKLAEKDEEKINEAKTMCFKLKQKNYNETTCQETSDKPRSILELWKQEYDKKLN